MNAQSHRKRATNVTLAQSLIEEAKDLGVNISEACQQGLEARVREARQTKWLEENGGALDAANRYVEANGLPLGTLRQF